MASIRKFEAGLSDEARELLIAWYQRRLTSGQDPERLRAYFGRMRELIEGRSPEQIEKMERERGLS